MSSEAKITEGDASEDALLTESAVLGPDNPTNAGGGGQDEQGEALVIPEKAEVGEKMINEPGVAVKSGFILIRHKNQPPVGGKRRAAPGTISKFKAKWAAREKAEKSKKEQHHH